MTIIPIWQKVRHSNCCLPYTAHHFQRLEIHSPWSQIPITTTSWYNTENREQRNRKKGWNTKHIMLDIKSPQILPSFSNLMWKQSPPEPLVLFMTNLLVFSLPIFLPQEKQSISTRLLTFFLASFLPLKKEKRFIYWEKTDCPERMA